MKPHCCQPHLTTPAAFHAGVSVSPAGQARGPQQNLQEPLLAPAYHPVDLMQDVQRALQAEKEAHNSETQKGQELEAMAQQLSGAKEALAEDAAQVRERMAALNTQHASLEERHTGLQQSHEVLASQNGTLRQQVGCKGDNFTRSQPVSLQGLLDVIGVMHHVKSLNVWKPPAGCALGRRPLRASGSASAILLALHLFTRYSLFKSLVAVRDWPLH